LLKILDVATWNMWTYYKAFLRAGRKLEKLVSILMVTGTSGCVLIYSHHFDKNKNNLKNCQQAKLSVTRVPKFKLHIHYPLRRKYDKSVKWVCL